MRSLRRVGRGLRVIDAVAAAWGSFRTGNAQAVWCDLGKPLGSAANEEWAWLHAILTAVALSAPIPGLRQSEIRQPEQAPVPDGPFALA
jgi:hypothetical protein